MDIRSIERLLEVYTFEEIMEFNGWTYSDILWILDSYNEVQFPEIKAVDLE